MYESCLKKEQKLYNSISGCHSFDDFKRIWKENEHQDIVESWASFIFELCLGEKQRLIGSKGRTPIEQLMSIIEIELEELHIEGMEEIKNDIKKEMEKDKLLQKLSAGTQNNNNNFDIWVPLEQDGFIDKTLDWMSQKAEKFVGPMAASTIVDILNAYFKGNKPKKERFKYTGKNELGQLTAIFSSFSKNGYKKQDNLINAIQRYLYEHAIQTTKIYNSWSELNSSIKQNIMSETRRIINLYFNTHRSDLSDYKYNSSNISPVQGLLGELYTFAKLYYMSDKINSKDIDILNLATMLNTKGVQSGVDILLRIDNETYGFQTKNPFKLKKGEYETYQKTWHLNKQKSMDTFYKNYIHITDEKQRAMFEMLNVNLTTSIDADQLEHSIISFLYNFAPEFMRLSPEELDQTKMGQEQKEVTSNLGKISNTFFILKGELIPCSQIVEGLIKQYEYFLDNSNEKPDEVLHISYKNLVKPNIVDSHGAYDESLVQLGEEYKKNLAKISIRTSLKLKIPSIRQLTEM